MILAIDSADCFDGGVSDLGNIFYRVVGRIQQILNDSFVDLQFRVVMHHHCVPYI